MRGDKNSKPQLFCSFHIAERISKDHPLRRIKEIADDVLKKMSRTFDAMYAKTGRPSIPPETLLKSQLLIALYSVRSDRLFCGELDTNFLFRWFIDMEMDESSIDHSTFSRNRQRLLENEVAAKFFGKIVDFARQNGILSDEHFTVDGTLIESLASLKSFQSKKEEERKPPADDDKGNPTMDFHGEKRTNKTHRSVTDPESRLYRKSSGTTANLCYMGNALMENRNGLCVGFSLEKANGKAERKGAKKLLRALMRKDIAPRSVGMDKGYHAKDMVGFCRDNEIAPHVAVKRNRSVDGIDGRTTRHEGYKISQRKRKLIEQLFGWMKTIGGLSKSRHFGRKNTEADCFFALSALNLLRISKLLPASA